MEDELEVNTDKYSEVSVFFEGLRPTPRLTVSEWADKYRYLSPVASAEPGRYRTDRTPYMRKIMDCLSAGETYKRVVFMKGAQVGATEAGSNFIGYVMHIEPAPIMMVQPTDDTVKRVSKGRIDPLIEACPELRERVSQSKSRDANNTITQKNFRGGMLLMTGGNSAVGLRSVPVRFLILDEVDGYPQDLDGEGSPVDLAIARTRTFSKKKIFIISTPTISGMSVVEREFLATDQNYYYVPCPHCGHMQPLVMSQLKWDTGKPHTAQYCCVDCGALIEERFKIQMFASGEWRPAVPENSNRETIGFHLNSLYSPYGWQSWGEIASEFVEAQKSQVKLKVFVNTVLGETWAERGEAPPFKNLYNRRESYSINTVPLEVCFITAGVDVQKDRLELEIVGWCADKQTYSIDYRVLEGDTAQQPVWNALAQVLSERWTRDDGAELPIRMMAVDSGYNTTHVYDFCRRFDSTRVIPIKGMDSLGMAVSPPKTVDVTRSGKRIGKLRVWGVGVSFLKSELYSWLRIERDANGVAPSSFCHFPQYDEHYFQGLTGEELVKKVIRGYPKYEWVKKYERNEPLDCRIYARAGAVVVGIDRLKESQLKAMSGAKPAHVQAPQRVIEDVESPMQAMAPVARNRKRSSYW